MYKRIKLNKKYSISFETFSSSIRKLTTAYNNGFVHWEADDSHNYGVVIGNFRLLFSIEKITFYSCN